MENRETREKAFSELNQSVNAALETYSNVHRGSGHNSIVSTHLFERARQIILEHLQLNKNKYIVIFSTPRGAEYLQSKLDPKNYQILSSNDIGLPLGVRAIAVLKRKVSGVTPSLTGGGTTVLMSPGWVIWAGAPDRFEAGTPPVINIIAFAKALLLIKKYGKELFQNNETEKLTAIEIIYKDELEKFSGKELLRELRLTQIGRGILVPTAEGSKPYINFDNSASTPTFEPVWKAVRFTLQQPAEVKHEIISEVKSMCSRFLGAPSDQYDTFFTSNTTEAINIAAENLSRNNLQNNDSVILSTLLEHSSNDLPWRMHSSAVLRLSIDKGGFVNLNELEQKLKEYNQQKLHGEKRIRIVQ
jgi:selenocysteine lyase/cysteine desulfurase